MGPKTKYYAQTMFLIGTITNLINTYVLIDEKYADITVCGFTICSTVVNSIIFGYIIGMHLTLSWNTIISLGMANIFAQIYIGFVLGFILKILLILTILSIGLISIPVSIFGIGLLLFAQLLYKLFDGVCTNTDFDDDAYFETVYIRASNCYEKFLNGCNDNMCSIWNWSLLGTGSGSGSETGLGSNEVLTQENNILNPNTAPDDETPV